MLIIGIVRESYAALGDALGHDTLAEGLLLSATRRVSLASALVASGLVDSARLASILEGPKESFLPAAPEIRPVMRLVDALPPQLCERLLALPVGYDSSTGTIDVAVVDCADAHSAGEIAYWLKAPVRVVRASLAAMTAALSEVAMRPRSGPEARGVLAASVELRECVEDDASSGVPTQRGPFQQSIAAEEAASTKRGN